MTERQHTIGELAELVGGELSGDRDAVISGVGDLSAAGPDQASWVSNPQYASRLGESKAGVVLIPHDMATPDRCVIRCGNIDRSVAALLGAFARPVPRPEPGIHPSAAVSDRSKIGKESAIGPHVVIEDGANVGDRCAIYAGVFIGRDCALGDDCVVWPNAVIREGCVLGNRVSIFPCAVIGADGFGFHFDQGRNNRVPHIGGVVIGDDVEIGACSCVDRAKLGNTTIGRGTKIDNLVQVGHNVRIGEHCVLAAQFGVGGSSRMGDFCVSGGQVGIIDNITLGRCVQVGGGLTTITHDIPDGMTVSGYPAQEHRKELRERALVRRLPKLAEQLRKLIERVERLESTTHNQS